MKSEPFQCRSYDAPDPLANRAVFAVVLILVVTLAMVGAALVMRWLT